MEVPSALDSCFLAALDLHVSFPNRASRMHQINDFAACISAIRALYVHFASIARPT